VLQPGIFPPQLNIFPLQRLDFVPQPGIFLQQENAGLRREGESCFSSAMPPRIFQKFPPLPRICEEGRHCRLRIVSLVAMNLKAAKNTPGLTLCLAFSSLFNDATFF
jgi:hypothetical protein